MSERVRRKDHGNKGNLIATGKESYERALGRRKKVKYKEKRANEGKNGNRKDEDSLSLYYSSLLTVPWSLSLLQSHLIPFSPRML